MHWCIIFMHRYTNDATSAEARAKAGGTRNGLVPLRLVLLWWTLPRERDPAPRQRDDGAALSEPVRQASGRGAVVVDRQRRLGRVQPRRRLPPRVPGRRLRSAQRGTRGGHGDRGARHLAP